LLRVNPKRGEIWRVHLEPTRGSEMRKLRPCVVISADAAFALPLRLVVPLTGWQDGFQGKFWLVRVDPSEQNGLSKSSAADTLQTRGVDLGRFQAEGLVGILEMSVLNGIVAAGHFRAPRHRRRVVLARGPVLDLPRAAVQAPPQRARAKTNRVRASRSTFPNQGDLKRALLRGQQDPRAWVVGAFEEYPIHQNAGVQGNDPWLQRHRRLLPELPGEQTVQQGMLWVIRGEGSKAVNPPETREQGGPLAAMVAGSQ
jgi:mRNA interferase MazF